MARDKILPSAERRERMRLLMGKLLTIWCNNPDLRFGQVLLRVLRYKDSGVSTDFDLTQTTLREWLEFSDRVIGEIYNGKIVP